MWIKGLKRLKKTRAKANWSRRLGAGGSQSLGSSESSGKLNSPEGPGQAEKFLKFIERLRASKRPGRGRLFFPVETVSLLGLAGASQFFIGRDV
jgi:hypothetical protein